MTPTVHSPSLLAGTNAGKVYIFSITLPAYNKRDQEDVSARIAKEVRRCSSTSTNCRSHCTVTGLGCALYLIISKALVSHFLQITLRHQAPVIGLTVIDGSYYPLPPALEVQNGRAKAPDMSANHKLLVVSEEQFKVSHFICHYSSCYNHH